MGFLSRLGDIVGGAWSGGAQTLGFFGDLVTAPFNDDEDFNGFWNTLEKRGVERFGEAATQLIGPERGLGALIGGLPEATRGNVGEGVLVGGLTGGSLAGPLGAGVGALAGGLYGIFRDPFEDLETVYREGVSQPSSTLAILGGQFGDGYGIDRTPLAWIGGMALGVFDPSRLKEAYRLAETTSPGKAILFQVADKDIFDPAEAAQFMGTRLYRIGSGMVDGFIRLAADPTVIGGKALAASRLRYLARPVANPAVRDAFIQSPRWARQKELLTKIAAESPDLASATGRIRGLLRKDEYASDVTAQLLAWAAQSGDSVLDDTFRFLSGDLSYLDSLERYAVSLADEGETLSFARRNAEEFTRLAGQGDLVDPAAALQYVVSRQRAASSLAYEAINLAEDAGTVSHIADPFWAEMSRFIVKNDPARATLLDDRLAEIGVEAANLTRIREAFASQHAPLNLDRGARLRDQVTHAEWYQSTPYGRAVQTLTSLRPYHLVNLEDSTAMSEQAARIVRDAKLPTDVIDHWRGRFSEAPDAATRYELLIELQSDVLRSVLDEFSISDDVTLESLKRSMRDGSDAARAVLNEPTSNSFSSEGAARVRHVDPVTGDVLIQERPLSVTQTADTVSTIDFIKVRAYLRKLDENGVLTRNKAGAVKDLAGEIAANIDFYWRAGAILRPAWPMRVVLGDGALRQAAVFGAIATVRDFPRAGRNILGRTARRSAQQFGLEGVADVTKAGAAIGAIAGGALAGPLGVAVGAGAGAGLARKAFLLEEAGYAGRKIGSRMVDGPFGAPDSEANVYRELLTVGRTKATESLIRSETKVSQRMRAGAEYRTILPTEPGHPRALIHALHNQIGQDGLWSQALRGISTGESRIATIAKMQAWLETPDGLAYLRKVPWRDWRNATRKQVWRAGEWVDQTADTWTQSLYDEALRLVGGNRDLATAAASRSLTPELIARHMPDSTLRPSVNGAVLDQAVGRSKLQETIHSAIDYLYEVLGGIPDEEIGRNPVFARFYHREIKRRLDAIPDDVALTEAQVHAIQKGARNYALKSGRHLLFDLAERSRFGEMTRYVMPFFDTGARDVVTSWGGIAVRNPAFVARAGLVWSGLERIPGMIHQDPDTGEKYVNMRIPEWAAELVNNSPLFRSAVDSQGYVRLSKAALTPTPIFGSPADIGRNLSATFGFGPFAQLAASKVVQAAPGLEESFRLILPYGPSEGLADAFTPATARRFLSWMRKEGDPAYLAAYHGILRSKLVSMNLGEIPRVDMNDPLARNQFLEDVKDETNALFRLRVVAAFMAPAQPTFDSPYWPYIEEYRRLQSEGEVPDENGVLRGPDERFWLAHGDEFFPLTQAMTKLNDGVRATMEGGRAREKYRDLIEAYPELGGLIVGNEAGGVAAKFSQAMYARQLSTPVSPGGEPQRERLTTQEFVSSPDVRLGWAKYSRSMDLLDAELSRRGLPNYQVKEARDLAELRTRVVEVIAEEHPGWAADREQRAGRDWPRFIAAMARVAADSRLAARPDISGLRDYLKLRGQVLELLAAREAKSLTAKANADIAGIWDNVVTGLRRDNPAFAELHDRWLENDRLEVV